jgi:hypothetical protein
MGFCEIEVCVFSKFIVWNDTEIKGFGILFRSNIIVWNETEMKNVGILFK